MRRGLVARRRRARRHGVDGCRDGRESGGRDRWIQRRIRAMPRQADIADMLAILVADMLDPMHGQQRLGPDEHQRGEQRTTGDQASGDHRDSGSKVARKACGRTMARDGTWSVSRLQRGVSKIIRQRTARILESPGASSTAAHRPHRRRLPYHHRGWIQRVREKPARRPHGQFPVEIRVGQSCFNRSEIGPVDTGAEQPGGIVALGGRDAARAPASPQPGAGRRPAPSWRV